MKKIYNITIIYSLLFALIFSATSCGGSEANKIKEGVITYDISYPYFKDEMMLSFMPKEMKMEFKDNIYRNTVGNSMFETSLISNCTDSTLIMMLHIGRKFYYSELDVALTDTMVRKNGIPDIVALNTTDSVAGYLCKKYMGVFDKLNDGYDCEVYETDEIGLTNSNWCNPYRELDGVLLGYEVDQFGIQMRFLASEVKDTLVSDSVFVVPSNYKRVSLERILYEVEELSKSI